jgi:hypothetical protein
VVAASLLIVFSVNLSGITGIIPRGINEKTDLWEKIDQNDKCPNQQPQEL